MSDPSPSYYRLAPSMAARLVGLGFVVFAVVVFGLTVLAALTSFPPDLIIVVIVVGVLLVIGLGSWLRSRAYVVRLDDHGYSVRLVRGAGVKDGAWSDVREALAEKPHEVPCVVLRRSDDTTTSIPVGLLAVDREVFARDVRDRLKRSRRPAS